MIKPIISFVVLILSIAFGFFYVVPAYNLNVERRGDIESLAQTLKSSEKIKTLISETKSSLGNINTDDLSRFEVFLPERIDTIRLANNVQYIGRKNRIILSDIKVEGAANVAKNGSASNGASVTEGLVSTFSVGAQVDKAEGTNIKKPTDSATVDKKYATTKISFTFGSSYETFQLFLNDLEKSLGLFDITSLSFTPDDKASVGGVSKGANSSPTYQYTMTLVTYSLK